jgi:hypothetical protein
MSVAWGVLAFMAAVMALVMIVSLVLYASQQTSRRYVPIGWKTTTFMDLTGSQLVYPTQVYYPVFERVVLVFTALVRAPLRRMSLEQLGAATGLSGRQLGESLAILQEMGWLTRYWVRDRTGRKPDIQYSLSSIGEVEATAALPDPTSVWTTIHKHYQDLMVTGGAYLPEPPPYPAWIPPPPRTPPTRLGNVAVLPAAPPPPPAATAPAVPDYLQSSTREPWFAHAGWQEAMRSGFRDLRARVKRLLGRRGP